MEPQSPLKLLVIDDEIDFADFVTDVAMGMDFDVSSTSDPSEFATLYSVDHDVIVLDLYMPGIDGIELLRFLSDNKSDASIIFMSGMNKGVLHSAQRLAIEQGMTVLGALQKPFLPQELEDMLALHSPRSTAQTINRVELPTIHELRLAIENEELYVVYQPQINMTDRTVVGVEALVRWKHSTKGMISPAYFIPIAEENGLISSISSYVNKTAISQQREWQKKGMRLRMSINMSPKILDDLDFPEKLEACVRAAGGNISDIFIEVTETSIMLDTVRYMDILARLRMKKFNLSIDDFGTGYSSLQQLVRAPFTELKIDQTFVKNLDTDEECRTIAEITILLAHKLGMHVVAEGIESKEIWEILQDLGCDEGQGYWIGKPMLPEAMEDWVESWATQQNAI